MIAESLVRHGGWLFRWRSYVLLAFMPLVLLAMMQPEPVEVQFGEVADLIYESTCIAITFLGFGIRVLTAGFVPAGTSGRNTRRQIAAELNVTGMYSVTRNPLYLGNAVSIMGIALFTQSLTVVLAMVLFLVIYLERIIAAEESFLAEKFGQPYLDWVRDVPAFLPRLSGWKKPALPFSIRTVLRREHSTLMALLLPLFVLDQMRAYLNSDVPSLDPAWATALVAGSLVYGLRVVLKKRTRILNVRGR